MFRRPSIGVSLATAVLVVLLSMTVPLSVAVAPASGGQPAAPGFADAAQIDADTVLLDVSITPDGDADWSIRYRVRLEDENDTAAFDSLEADVSENRSAFTSRFADRMQRTVRAAENATGRDMAVRNVSVRTTRQEIPQRYGVLVYEFEWTNFAVVDGSTIRAGDAIGGLFLDDSTSITFHWPEAYGLASADPSPDDAGSLSATWRGPRDFTNDQPGLVVSEAAATGGADGSGGEPADGSSDGLDGTTLALVALVVAGAVLGAGLWWRGRTPAAPATTGSSPESGPPDELLSNEERVLRLLEQHGGRIKQQRVVEELDWTDAKTSQVVGVLRESGEVDVFRLGRENVIDLPSEDDGEGSGGEVDR
jgi:hypothetical protein